MAWIAPLLDMVQERVSEAIGYGCYGCIVNIRPRSPDKTNDGLLFKQVFSSLIKSEN